MEEYKVYTVYTKDGKRETVKAMSTRHAVAIIVARRGLNEQQTASVVNWCVARKE